MVWFDVAGWLGALLTASAYSMRDMKWLRVVAVGANLSFITYGFAANVWPMLALHLFLLPLNLFRLSEIVRAARRLRRSRDDAHPLSALKPFLKPVSMAAGHVLFRRGDEPDRVYVLEDGEIELPELEKRLGPGTLFGEMAFFAPMKARTTSAVCRTPCRILAIDEDDFMRLFHQNPEFGVYVLRLIARRLLDGSRDHADLYSPFTGDDAVGTPAP